MSTAFAGAAVGRQNVAGQGAVLRIVAGQGAVLRIVETRVRLHLTKRGRMVFTTLAAIPLVIAAAVFALNGGGAVAKGTDSGAPLEYVTLEAGQSLWQLAEQLAPNSDPRDFIADLVQLNQLDSSGVEAGQQLAIPAAYSS